MEGCLRTNGVPQGDSGRRQGPELLACCHPTYAVHYNTITAAKTNANGSAHCDENSRIFLDAAYQTLPLTEYSEIYN